MSDQIKQIAVRIKDLREIYEISIKTLADEFNVPVKTYEQYENGEIDIPIGFLNEFANRFNVELTELLTGDSPKLHHYALVRKGKGIEVERRKPYKYQSLAYKFTHKKAEPFLVSVVPEENKEISLSSHPGQEFNYVIEGSLKIVVAGKEMILNQGDSLYFDATQPHGMKAVGNEGAKFLAIIF